MTIDHRKVVALATHETPFVKRVDDIDDYQVTTTVTRYTKSVWLTDRFKTAALDLNFAYNKSLTDSITGNNLVTFSRASSGTYVGADGLIKTSPVNLFTHSEQLNAWVVGGGSSVTANQAVAPNGTNTADRVQHGSGGSSWIRQDVLTSGVTYTVSVYAKAVTPGTNDQFTFDLGGLSSVFTATNEWQRFTFTGTASNASIYLNNGDDSFATDVYFWGAQVEEGSVATDYIPTTNTSGGAPRFDHDPVTGESLGLLIEEARTNILLKSEKLDAWFRGSNSSVTANQAVAPDGTTTADRVQHNSAGSSWLRQNVLTSGVTYTVSVYAKAVTPGTNDQFSFELGFTSPIFTATGEWQRFTFTGTAIGSSVYLNNANDSFATDVYFWGAQVEEGGFATSYIPTDSSTVTRAADIVDITGTNFNSFYNTTEGSLFASYSSPITSGSNDYDIVTFIKDNDSNRKLQFFVDLNASPAPKLGLRIRNGPGVQRTAILTETKPFLNFKSSASFGPNLTGVANANDPRFATNNVLQTTSSGSTIIGLPGFTKLTIGSRPDLSGGRFINGHFKRLAYFPTRLSDTALQSITS